MPFMTSIRLSLTWSSTSTRHITALSKKQALYITCVCVSGFVHLSVCSLANLAYLLEHIDTPFSPVTASFLVHFLCLQMNSTNSKFTTNVRSVAINLHKHLKLKYQCLLLIPKFNNLNKPNRQKGYCLQQHEQRYSTCLFCHLAWLICNT